MSFSPALVYDFIFLAVFSFAAVKSWQKGFLAGLTELIGAVLGVGIASWGSRTLAPEVYLSFFSDSVSTWTFCRNPSVPRWPRVCRLPGTSCPKRSTPCWSRFSCRWCRRCCLCCSA